MPTLIELEAELFAQRQQHIMTHLNEKGEREEASLGTLSTNLGSNPDETARKSSHDALLDLERWVLANMAVYQTRAYFLREYGYLTDNPAIGPLLAKHYWGPGNGVSHNQTLVDLTGEGFSARYLAELCNQSAEETWLEAQRTMAAASARKYSVTYPDSLDATIRLVHGAELIADNTVSDATMFTQFERWIGAHYGSS